MVNEQTKRTTSGENGFDGCQTEPNAVVDDIVSLEKSMGLEINDTNVEELVKEHSSDWMMERYQKFVLILNTKNL